MNDKKQIEEMAKDVLRSVAWKELEDGAVALDVDVMTSNLYNIGYRKQEWISVDEALPENEGEYLVFTEKGNIKVMPFFTERNASAAVYGGGFCEFVRGWRTNDDDWWKPVGYVTHWMPLPEPPKGGAE